MSNNLEKKVNSGYIKKKEDGSFEVKYFETLKQRQRYLLENDVTKKYKGSPYYSKYVNSRRTADKFVVD
tara:strand:+ start:2194 stop:2400 length:207 start_codon:yes stop_codon:yes gene_type:complete